MTIRVERELELHLKLLKNPLLAVPTPRIITMHHSFFAYQYLSLEPYLRTSLTLLMMLR
jgi:hypothetical protein